MFQRQKYIKRKKKQRMLKKVISGMKLHKNIQMLDCLMDTSRDVRQIRLPFSVNQVGVYHEVLLAGTEKIQQQRDLLQTLDQCCRGTFGGPMRSDKAWIDFEKYRTLRGLGVIKCSVQKPPSASSLLRKKSHKLSRCPTPPPASDLFIGFLDNEKYRWTSFIDQLDEKEAPPSFLPSSDSSYEINQRENHSKNVYNTCVAKNHSSDVSSCFSSSHSQCSEDELSLTDSLDNHLVFHHSPVISSVFDRPLKISNRTVRLALFKHHHGYLQPKPFATKMSNLVLKLHHEFQEAQTMIFARSRIRYRLNNPIIKEQESLPSRHNNSLHEFKMLDPLQLIPEFIFQQPLTSQEELCLLKYIWRPRGLVLFNTPFLDLPLHHAWDIGKRGCLAKMTVYPDQTQTLSHYVNSHLRYLIMDGTDHETFVTIYTSGHDMFFPHLHPRRIGSISLVNFLNAHWNASRREIQIRCATMHQTWYTVLLQSVPIPFFSALIISIRFNIALRHLFQIRNLRHVLQQLDGRIHYATALKGRLCHMKMFNSCEDE